MNRISDELAILQTLHRFTHAQDRLDVAMMASLITPDRTIEFDLSKHFADVGVLKGTAMEMANILYEASAGWTATQHPLYNPVVTLSGGGDPQNASKTTATVKAMVQAYHCLEMENGQVESLTVRATWDVEMEKKVDANSRWLIVGMAMERDIPIANAGLFEKMRARVAEGKKRKPTTSSN